MKILFLIVAILLTSPSKTYSYYRPLDAPWYQWEPDIIPGEEGVSIVDYGVQNTFIPPVSHSNFPVYIDAELHYLDFHKTKKINPNFEIGASTKLVFLSKGFLDSGVSRYHEAFNFANGDRNKFPSDTLRIEIPAGKNSITQNKSSFRPVHPEFFATFKKQEYLLFRLHLKLPTSLSATWHSNGSLGSAISAQLGKKLNKHWASYLNLMVGYWGGLRGYTDDYVNSKFLGVLVSNSLFWKNLELEFHFTYFSPRFKNIGYHRIDGVISQFKTGLTYELENKRKVFVLFSEEFLSFSPPDFALNVGMDF